MRAISCRGCLSNVPGFDGDAHLWHDVEPRVDRDPPVPLMDGI